MTEARTPHAEHLDRASARGLRADRTDRQLPVVATVFALAVLVHNADHLRRGGDSVSADVFWIGTLAILIEVGVVALIFMRHPTAPVAAAVGGFWLALGYVFVHFTPQRDLLSDSFTGGGASWLSLFAAAFEAAAAVLLGLAGLEALRRSRSVATSTRAHVDGLPFAEAVRNPIVAALIIGNIVIIVGSFATR